MPTRRGRVSRLSLALALVAMTALLGRVGPSLQRAYGAFSVTTTNSGDNVQAATLQPPGGPLNVTQSCTEAVPTANLSWSATPTTGATGYHVARGATSLPNV